MEKKFDATGIEQLLTFTDEQEKTLDMNHTGIAVFHMAFQGSNSADCITMVADSKTLEWPSGQCWKVVRDLEGGERSQRRVCARGLNQYIAYWSGLCWSHV